MHLWGTQKIEGRWHIVAVGLSGEHLGEPESDTCAKWRAEGCRCYQHRCGCTTGWQPKSKEE